MQSRTASSLLYILSFLLVAATTGSAQMVRHPDPMDISLDSSYLHYNMNQPTVPQYTVHGSIVSLSYSGSVMVQITPTKQWITSTMISGKPVHDGDWVGISPGQTLPIVLTLTPNAERSDTEMFLMGISDGTNGIALSEIFLYTTSTTSAVTAVPSASNITISPNPAANYIFARGLSGAQLGCMYEIYSITGAEIRHGILPSDARINVQDLSSGAYRLLLFNGKQTISNSAITILH